MQQAAFIINYINNNVSFSVLVMAVHCVYKNNNGKGEWIYKYQGKRVNDKKKLVEYIKFISKIFLLDFHLIS